MLRSCYLRAITTTLLAAWMAVLSAGVWVTHAHAATARHVHGQGLNPLCCQTLPLSGNSPLASAHRHLLLLGFEFPEESAPDRPVDCKLTQAESSETPAPSFLAQQLVIDPVPVEVVFDARLQFADQPTFPAAFPSARLSHFASRTISGVLRS